jgi:hypothetical protein
MTIDERILAGRTVIAALVAASVALAPSLVFAQDPPPPLAPSEPDAPPPAPPPAPEPPRTDVVPAPLAPVPLAPVPLGPAPIAPPVAPPPVAPTYALPRSGRPADKADAPRVLYGHAFITPALVDSAFPQSHVGIAAEVGRRWDYGVINQYPPPGSSMSSMTTDSIQFDQTTTVSTQSMSFGVLVSDHVELGASGSYASQLSSDLNSTVQFGSKSAWTFRPSARFELSRSPTTVVGLHLFGDFGGDNQQSLPTLFAELAAEATTIASNGNNQIACIGAGDLSCALANPGAVNTSTTRVLAGAGAALALAHAFSPTAGLQFAAGVEVGHRSTNTAGTVAGSVPINLHVGVAPSIDFGPKVPVSLMGEYQLGLLAEPFTSLSTSNTDGTQGGDGTVLNVTNSLIAGVYYTGRRDLSVGALLNATFIYATELYSDGSSALGPPITIVTAQATARYYF